MTSGGGSKAWEGEIQDWDEEEEPIKLYYDGQGFMSVEMNQEKAEIVFYEVFGKVLHRWNISKHPHQHDQYTKRLRKLGYQHQHKVH